MEGCKLLIAEGSEEFTSALAQELGDGYTLRLCHDGKEALELIGSFQPDVLVLDLMLPGMDGISILGSEQLRRLKPAVLATSRLDTPYVVNAAQRLGVSYFMVKPCSVAAAAARVEDLAGRYREPLVTLPSAETRVTNLLLKLGVLPNHKGYVSLREAILQKMHKSDQAITKELYPNVARMCGSRYERVERNVRTAIESAWERRDDRVWRRYFPVGPDGTVPKPKAALFMCVIADVVLYDLDLMDDRAG